ncbi:MAG TPA: arsenate reductase ArsC [bacterium]|nr:arsenate reductase ArsC [bacterium]
MEKQTVLFICTRNACRSQMAEALVNHFLGDRWEAFSAGTKPGTPHPLALRALAEIGVAHPHAKSESLDVYADRPFDLVVTLCGDADQNCPVFFGGKRREHIGFDNPDAAAGSEEERMAVFRRVRDEIKETILARLRAYDPDEVSLVMPQW